MAARSRNVSVPMFDPVAGKVVAVRPQDVEAAQDEGMTVETAETAKSREYQQTAGLGEAAKATAEGFASGATLGLSDVALSELGGDDYRLSRKLRGENFGGFETAGNVAGSVLPVLLSGGESLAGKVAASAPTSLAARLAGAAERGVGSLIGDQAGKGALREALGGAARWGAAGAVEGGLAGAGNALSEAALADELGSFDDVAERAWAGARSGSMMGLFGGAALGGMAGAASGAARSFGRRFMQSGDELAEAANERAVKALDPRGTELRKLKTDEKIQQVGQDLREYQLMDGTPVLDWWDSAETLAPKVARARGEVAEELGALRQRVAASPEPVNALGYLERVDKEVIRPLLDSPSPTIRRNAKKAMGELEEFATRVGAGDEITYADLLNQQRALKAVAYPKRAPGQGLPVAPPEWTESIARAERILEEQMEGHVEKVLSQVSPDDVGRYADLRRLTESFTKADQILQKSTKQNLGNRAVSLTDYLTGLATGGAALASGHPIGAVAGIAAAAGHKLMRERGSATLAALYSRVASVDARMERTLGGFFREAGEKAELASAKPQSAALREVSRRGPDAVERTASEARETVARRLDTAKRTVNAAGAAGADESGVFSVSKALRAQRDETPDEAYDRVVARAQGIASGDAIGPYMVDEVAPNVGNAMRSVQQRAAQYLLSTAPVPPRKATNPNLGELVGDTKPDPVRLYEFARRVAAIDDPHSILDDLRKGTLSIAAVEAVSAVYPREFARMRAAVLEHLGNAPKLLPYTERVRIGIMFGLPTDQTLQPQMIAIAQGFYAQQQKPGAPRPTATQMAASTQRIMSPSEQMESGISAAK